MAWINPNQYRSQRLAVVTTVTKLRVPQQIDNLFTSCGLLHENRRISVHCIRPSSMRISHSTQEISA